MQEHIEKYIIDDIFKTLKSYKSNYDIDDKTYEKICKMRIRVYMKQINFKNNKINKKYGCSTIKNKKNICKCRIWSNGHALQCSNTIKKNELCKTHNNMLDKYGVLRYGKIYLPKPRHDFVDGKLLNWK